jgi:NitT/TauT family transport system substrate-binding protein
MEGSASMPARHRSSVLSFCALVFCLTVLLPACGNSTNAGGTTACGNGTNGGTATTSGNSASSEGKAAILNGVDAGEALSSSSLQDVSIGLGYDPDVQFSPFYVAQSKGYYKTAGLNVTLNHGVVTDLVGSLSAGKTTFVFASGDELLMARDKNKGFNAIDVAAIYQKYPVSLIVPVDSPIKTLVDLKGHSIGVPGPFGATYTGLLALLYNAHLSLSDVNVQSIGFNQVSALSQHHVDAVMGYSNNEPLQLERGGLKVRTFVASDYQPLVSNSILVTEQMYRDQPQVVKNFVQATIKGLQTVLDNPCAAVDVSKSYVPGMDTGQALAVLQATLPIYKGSGHLGYNDSATWSSMEQFLVAQKMIAPVPNLSQVYTNDLLP